MKLGKKPRRHDPRTLRLAAYMAPELPAPLLTVDWTKALPVDLGEMGNSSIGDCTCAGAGHLVQTWTANRGDEITISDEAIIAAYSAITGYTPSDPSTDNGAVLLDVLNFWRQTGIGGHKIGAYACVNHADVDELKIACDLFGGLFTGVQLPTTAQAEVGAVWQDTTGEVGSWGGHCVALVGYDTDGVTYLTWGKRQRATWAWVAKYADEAYAIVAADWVNGSMPAPSGFDLAALQADLAAVGAAR